MSLHSKKQDTKEPFQVESGEILEIKGSASPSYDKGQLEVAGKHMVGAELFQELLEGESETSDKEYAPIRRKIDRWLLPVLCVTYMLQFLDKLSLNYASAYSLSKDLNFKGNDYSNIAAIFNVGYLVGSIPANWVIQKLPVAKYTGCALIVWAVLLVAHIGRCV